MLTAARQQRGKPEAPASDVYLRIRNAILCCALLPGSPIFEQQLAKRYRVSKSPVRDALLRLREQHLVEVLPRKGYRVLPISVSDAIELYEMRLLYEQACVTGAIDGASDAELASLDTFRKSPARKSLAGWIAYNRAYHIAIAGLCGNARLARAAIGVIEQFDRLTYIGLRNAGQTQTPELQAFVDEHARLTDAMKRRNKRLAHSLVRRHIENSRRRTLDAIANPVVVP